MYLEAGKFFEVALIPQDMGNDIVDTEPLIRDPYSGGFESKTTFATGKLNEPMGDGTIKCIIKEVNVIREPESDALEKHFKTQVYMARVTIKIANTSVEDIIIPSENIILSIMNDKNKQHIQHPYSEVISDYLIIPDNFTIKKGEIKDINLLIPMGELFGGSICIKNNGNKLYFNSLMSLIN